MNRMDEYLQRIRALEGLKNAFLSKISITKRTKTVEFCLITDKAYTVAEENTAKRICEEFLPDGFSAQLSITKRVPDEGILKKQIYRYMSDKFPAAAAFLTEEDIEVEMLTSGANFYFSIASGEQGLFSSGAILDDVSAYLKSGYCGTFYGNVKVVEKETPDISVLEEEPQSETEEDIKEIRRFAICDFKKIDGVDEIPKQAVYIADYLNTDGGFSVCGRVDYIEEKQYVRHNEKTGEDVEKTRFTVTLNDGTGMLRTTYFPKKATVEKVREIQVGDSVVLTGEVEEFNGYRSFKTAKINFGKAPEGFVPEARKGKPVPKFYHTVFPEPYVDYTQAGLFDDLSKPNDLKNNVFVVFDLETTGLNNNPAMGKMDKIIEIGAVKLVNGEMTEKFSSFVACEERLSKEIIELTGIEDSDLVGAPTVDKVIADFFKFIDGAFLVGHNVTFDYRFVHYYGEQNGYMIENRQFDTLTIAQDVLRGRLANYKLNTVADHYGITFNHHRAFDDACTTAKIFIEMVKQKGKLPL